MLPNELQKILEQLQQEMQLGDETMFGSERNSDFTFGPDEYVSEVREDEDSITVIVDFPDYTKEDIDIEFTEETLVIEASAAEGGIQRSMQKGIHIGQNVDVDKIDAQFKNGILTVEIPQNEVSSGIQLS